MIPKKKKDEQKDDKISRRNMIKKQGENVKKGENVNKKDK